MNITHAEPDRFVGLSNSLSVSPIDVSFGTKSFSSPEIAANSTDLKCFEDCELTPKLKLTQFIRRSYHVEDLDYADKVTRITGKYEKLIKSYPSAIPNFHFQYPMKQNLGKKRRTTLETIQVDAGAQIVSTYESRRTQSVTDFETELLESKDKFDECVVAPSLDMGIVDEGLFDEKLDFILRNFKRFNVIYRSINKHHDNWITLSERISGRNVWAHVVGIIPLLSGRKQKISNLSRIFLFGIHSASQGFSWKPTVSDDVFLFNPVTICYEESSRRMSYEESRVDSFIKQKDELRIAERNMLNQTYFSKYVPSKLGLNQSLILFS